MQILKIFYTVLVVLLSFFYVIQSSFADGNDSAERVLLAGTSADYPPFEFIKEDKIVGFDIDLAHMIAEKLGYKLQVKDMKFASIISAIRTDRIDFGVAAVTITTEREKNLDFSIRYYIPKLAMVYKISNPILSVKDLNQKTIVAQVGTTMESFLQEKLKENENFTLISLHKTPVMIAELNTGRVDGVLVEEAQAKVFMKKYPKTIRYSLFSSIGHGYAIVLKKGSPLKAKIDSAIRSLQRSGEIKKLEQKWFQSH